MITEFRRHGGGRMVWNSEGKGGFSILEFPKARGGLDEDAAHGRVWIFSGITHRHQTYPDVIITGRFVFQYLDWWLL